LIVGLWIYVSMKAVRGFFSAKSDAKGEKEKENK
jgi:hypothetical protein